MDIPQSIKDIQELKESKRRRIWKPFMEKYNIQKLAEIGVFGGYNFNLMIEHNPEVAVGVDAWFKDEVVAHNDCGWEQDVLDKMAGDVVKQVINKPFVHILREYTTNAAKLFPDEYFDLIYIDADHTYEGCKADIEAWYPKVKKGGFIIGDDYSNMRAPHTGVKFGVIKAVNEFFNNNTIYQLPMRGWAVIK